MKIRTGFVSNSSSSSFVCDVCGEECSGMDMCLSDAQMYQCENGHTFCESHALEVDEEEGIDDRYEANEKHCPVCQFKVMTEIDLSRWFFATHPELSKESILKAWKEEYGDYKTFLKLKKGGK